MTLRIAEGETVDANIPLIDQGVDSLGAVTVSTWFSKQLFLDLPLLKVLGGASVSDLADDAATRLPATSIPLVLTDDESAETSDNDAVATPTYSASDGGTAATTANVSPAGELEDDEGAGEISSKVVRREKLSLGQEYSWRQQQLVEDNTTFNNTIGMFMKGAIDLDRLSRAVDAALRRHEIFRTGFIASEADDDNSPMQVVHSRSANRLQLVQVASRAEAEENYRALEKTRYEIAAGDTLRPADFHWGADDHLLVIGYHRLVGDGTTTENLFNEIGQLYKGVTMSPPSSQFVDLAMRQQDDVARGRMDKDIAFWESMHSSSPSPVLPIMNLTGDGQQQRQPQRPPCSWQQNEAIARLDPMVAFRITERSRKSKATPMHFYLAAYHVLLTRLTGSNNVTIGIADTNRPSLEELSAMGFFANVLPLRFDELAPGTTFSEHLAVTKDRMREVMQHARVPCGVVLDRLGLTTESTDTNESFKNQTHAPGFQAVFDYKQGQAESGSIGDANMTEVLASRERTPYDIVLEMWNDPTKDPLIHVKLQSSLYGEGDARAFAEQFAGVLRMYSMNPSLKLT